MRKCVYCDRFVKPHKNPNWFLLLILLVLTSGIGLFFYAIYFFCIKDEECPICGGKDFEDRKGRYSIRINLKYRICFAYDGRDLFEVEIVDYH